MLWRIASAVLALCLLGVVSWTDVQADCSETGGQLLREDYRSSLLNTTMVYSIYLPPCYEQLEGKLPSLYLLHGSNEDDGHWPRIGLIESLDRGILSGEYVPMIVVMPFGDWLANENDFGAASWANVLVKDLIPAVESAYRVDPVREKRAIGGISRGGFWAYSIGMRHPDLFSRVGGHSAFLDQANVPPEFDPFLLAGTAAGLDSVRFWLDRGPADYAAPGIDRLRDLFRQGAFSLEYVIYPQGEHNNTYWSQHIDDYLRFYTGQSRAETTTPVFATATPRPVVGKALFVPAVAFPSTQTTLSAQALSAVLSGAEDQQLILDQETAAALASYGVRLNPQIRIVEADSLENRLLRDRSLYTILPFDRLSLRYRVLWIDDVHPLDQLDRYPLIFESQTPNFDPERLTRIAFSGVTALARKTREALDQNGVPWAVEAILPYAQRVDFFHTSSEVSIYPTCPQTSGPTLGGALSFCAKAEHFDLFTRLGVDIVELTGNHNNDYGYEAYTETLDFFRQNNIATVGGGATLEEAQRPLLLNHHENRIALVACNAIGPYYALVNEDAALTGGVRPGASPCDWEWLTNTLPLLAAQHDIVIVTVQHQEFEEYLPSAAQRFEYRRLAELGADMVIGTAPHKPQVFEFYNTGRGQQVLIHYGLGNLFFDQEFWGNVRFFIDTPLIYEGKILTVDLFPGLIESLGRPRLMTEEERANFLFFLFVQQNGL